MVHAAENDLRGGKRLQDSEHATTGHGFYSELVYMYIYIQ